MWQTKPYFVVVISVFFLLASCANCYSPAQNYSKNPSYNFVLILTDDQDIMLNGLMPMTKTLQHLANEGATFANAFTTSPVCCPSRSSLLTGKYAHNHKTQNNSISGGCYGQFWQQTIEPSALPAMLLNAGYETFFAGKYLNEYFSDTIPPGWSQWFGLHGNSRYYNFTVNENGKTASYSNQYFTDYLHHKSIEFLSRMNNERPFYAMISPPAPHAPFTPAKRHDKLFPNVKAMRTPNFNISSSPLRNNRPFLMM